MGKHCDMSITLSVNVNKIATLRNSRGGNIPNLLELCVYILSYPVQGITVHPRPDERHIRYDDVHKIRELIQGKQELNIEGNPKFTSFIDLVIKTKPHQVTLVPDDNQQLTSDHGWDTIQEATYLTEIITYFKSHGIRTSLFISPDIKLIEAAKHTGTDRIELYTESYAKNYRANNPTEAVQPYIAAASTAHKLSLEINAGHDLSLENLAYFAQQVPHVREVSIGHALIADALYFGLGKTIQLYLDALQTAKDFSSNE